MVVMAEQTRAKRTRGSWRRVPERRMLGGVAAGVSAWTGIDVTVVRTIFVFLAVAGGFGVACYLAAWLLVPATGETANIGSAALAVLFLILLPDRRPLPQVAVVPVRTNDLVYVREGNS